MLAMVLTEATHTVTRREHFKKYIYDRTTMAVGRDAREKVLAYEISQGVDWRPRLLRPDPVLHLDWPRDDGVMEI